MNLFIPFENLNVRIVSTLNVWCSTVTRNRLEIGLNTKTVVFFSFKMWYIFLKMSAPKICNDSFFLLNSPNSKIKMTKHQICYTLYGKILYYSSKYRCTYRCVNAFINA